MKDNIFKFGIKNELRSKASLYNIKKVIFRKHHISILNLLLIGLAVFIFGMIISRCPSCSVYAANESAGQCPELNCSGCELQKQLRIINTYVCPDKTIAGDPNDCLIKERSMQKYVCEDGSVMDNPDDCKETLEIDTEHQKTENNITLAVDGIDYDMKGDDWGTITQISYAVKNIGESTILPEIQVKVYNESDSAYTKTDVRHTIKINKTLEKDEFAQGVEDVYISFKGLNITAKLVLVNGLDEVYKAKVVLEMPLFE